MKLYIKTLAIVLFTILSSACNNEDMVPVSSDHMTGKSISITVGGIGTRAGYEEGEIINSGSLTFWIDQPETKYDAKHLEINSQREQWVPMGTLVWHNGTDVATYAAVYPHQRNSNGIYNITVPTKQTEENIRATEVLYATGTAKGEDGAINIVFKHTLAQLKVNLTIGETLGKDVEIESVRLSNAALSGTFTAWNDNYKCEWGTPTNPGEITLLKNNETEFECILIPQTIEDYYVIVDAIVDGKRKGFQFESSGLVLKQGTTYTLPLQVGGGVKKDYPYVDLGLTSGLLWAKCNVGATAPEDIGDYFAWAETAPKTSYNFKNEGDYKYGIYDYQDTNNYGTTKYNNIDGKTTLEAIDDAATTILGSKWRMPTVDEFDELLTECTWTATSRNDVSGFEVKGQNGNSIFIPMSGYRRIDDLNAPTSGYYWTSSLVQSEVRSASILQLDIISGVSVSGSMRYFGLPVRAVCTQ